MMEPLYDRVNDFTAVSIRLASPNDILSWSYGEVRKPETINYRTYRSEKDGLFCERIFGPERDWECSCGKYKGIKHKGIICDRCGIKITHSRVRRSRMGHINLAAPVVHIWFFKAMPSRLGNLLAMKTTSLERIIYYQDYVVIDPGDTPLKEKQLLSEEEYRFALEKYGDGFEADMGAEAIRRLITKIELETLATELVAELEASRSKQKQKDLVKRLKIVKTIIASGNKAEWMVMDVIPVIPPDLRPLVLLESGNFATSDLNDLYRRLINRNNRLKKLLDLNAPDVIIRNEKRMLQHSVDALFDNNRCRRPVLGSNNRPLKSLTDMIKGKQGRFRENLLGKRVDYSARSVIAVGPELKLHQCGLPKKIALELFQPFIIRRLKELGYADTIKSAKKMLERKDEEVWDILEEVTRGHPVLLNRAPTLHRMGIQAFEPVLIEGNAILIHPLVCEGFNADFDGDQMAVHLPLSVEAQIEATNLMLSTNNVFSPAHGNPIIAPSQDIVLGCHYLTVILDKMVGEGMRFSNREEVFTAHASSKVHMHAQIRVRMPEGIRVVDRANNRIDPDANGLYATTPGRIIFNDILPAEMCFYNHEMGKKDLKKVIHDCYQQRGRKETLRLLDSMKDLGVKAATRAGLSFSVDDLRIPPHKLAILQKTQGSVDRVEGLYQRGVITEGERYNQIIDLWTHATEEVGDELMKVLKHDVRPGDTYLNPIYQMVSSGSRGSVTQIRQLAGMRGLMAKPSGRIIETPIKASFREGLRVLEYFSSTHGARKGLADTALKTADSGYLTRKLADVAQNVVVTDSDCGTLNGITKEVIYRGDKIEVSLAQNIRGRVSRTTIRDIVTDDVVVRDNDMITDDIARKIEALGYTKMRVRSPLTCEASLGVCAQCYGMDLSTGRMAEEGLAVGIIAAQSIGEPGTQLTMRTFHIGGIASKAVQDNVIRASSSGRIVHRNLRTVQNPDGETIVLNRTGEIIVEDKQGREVERHGVPLGAVVQLAEGSEVRPKQPIYNWDPHMIPIIAEKSGKVEYEDIVEGATLKVEIDPVSKKKRRVIVEHKGELHPQIVLRDVREGAIIALYPIPEKAHIEVERGQDIAAGTLLAKTPREITGTQDITGGLPRVTEIFEVRRPKNPAVIAEIDGSVEMGEKKRGKTTIIVRSERGIEQEHMIPHGKHYRVHKGDVVLAGDPLVDGDLVPRDILRIKGVEAVQDYLLREVQKVYRSQNVTIDDKHIEIIVGQMLRNVSVLDPGDAELLPSTVIDKFRFRRTNEAIVNQGKKPATAEPLLLGITKASLQSESFISAASFQETTKVLTEAALAGKTDNLLGLKENVIMGHMIPAGTGFRLYFEKGIKKLGEPKRREVREPVAAAAAAATAGGDVAAKDLTELLFGGKAETAEGESIEEPQLEAEPESAPETEPEMVGEKDKGEESAND
ncbi:MAG: DNA-directed RNA polymerase subunit beta' [Planctomycetes bacterium]|nr:DNA-directed RNA polymerase subunit beta' [Planctomycetota bacterium]